MITKSDLVIAAYEELRISGITVHATPEDVVLGTKRLEAMILGWQNKGLCLAYNKSDTFVSIDPNDDSGISDNNSIAVILNLAKTLCPAFGKQLHPDTRAEARVAYLGLFGSDMTYREKDPYQPTGSGHSFGYGYDDRFRFQGQEDNAPVNCSTIDIKVGQIDFYPIDFNYYLDKDEGDTIASYTVDDGQGVSILSDSESEGVITLQAEGLTEGLAPIKITVTTTNGRVNPQTVNFNVLAT